MSDIQFSPAYASVPPTPEKAAYRERIKKYFSKLNTMFFAPSTSTHESASRSSFSSGFNTRKFKNFFKKSAALPIAVLVIFLGIGGYIMIQGLNNNNVTSVLGDDQRIDLRKPKAQFKVNRQFLFPLKDDTGAVVSQLKLNIENVELRDEIIVKGQRATTQKGRTFMIVNLKITNDYDRPIQINSRDYIRILMNNNAERLAPDIHNDPVEIQAISTKYTRVGLPINDTDKNLILQVGEITGAKEDIKISF